MDITLNRAMLADSTLTENTATLFSFSASFSLSETSSICSGGSVGCPSVSLKSRDDSS